MIKLKTLLVILTISIAGFSQQQIKGQIKKPGGGRPLAGAQIKVIGKNIEAKSDSTGNFQISVAIADTLLVEAAEYKSQRVAITSLDNKVIFLQPSIPVYSFVEEQAEFRGGLNKFHDYVSRKLRHPKGNQRHGKIYVHFVIDTTGMVVQKDTEVIKAVNEKTDNETHKLYDNEIIRVVNTSPPWKPARQEGKKVRFATGLPISF